jgi:hypothetical protein
MSLGGIIFIMIVEVGGIENIDAALGWLLVMGIMINKHCRRLIMHRIHLIEKEIIYSFCVFSILFNLVSLYFIVDL